MLFSFAVYHGLHEELFEQTAALCPTQITCSHLQSKNSHLLSKAAPSSANSRYPVGFTGIAQGCEKYRWHISEENSAQSIPFIQGSSSVPVWAKLLQKQSLLSSQVLLFKLLLCQCQSLSFNITTATLQENECWINKKIKEIQFLLQSDIWNWSLRLSSRLSFVLYAHGWSVVQSSLNAGTNQS